MTSGAACLVRTHRPHWYVVQRKYNQSAFNGYRRTPSDYSLVRCALDGAVWRTKAAYVDQLPDTRPKDATS